MDKHAGLKTGDKIKIVDEACPYFGQIGEVKEIAMVDKVTRELGNAKWREGKIVKAEVELEGINKRVCLLEFQFRKL